MGLHITIMGLHSNITGLHKNNIMWLHSIIMGLLFTHVLIFIVSPLLKTNKHISLWTQSNMNEF